MQQNQQTIDNLYGAFSRLDGQAMQACYAPDAVFEDEVFQLRGQREVGGMWRMLCEAAQANRPDWQLQWRDVQAGGDAGQAHWDARYRFGATGRLVDNSVESRFTFDDQGRILQQRDSFDFWRWSRQALGTPGLLLGWTPVLRTKVRATAAQNLQKYLAKGST